MADTKSKLDRHRRRLEGLKTARQDFEALWQDEADYVAPDRFRLTENSKPGQKNRSKIVDSTASRALRILKSGMQSGVTSPSRPWFKGDPFDPDLKEYEPAREYLDDMVARMRMVIAASNTYNCFHTGYGDLGLFGDDVCMMVEDPTHYVHLHQLVHGEYWIANDYLGMADTLYRRFPMTAAQIIGRFKNRGGVIPYFVQNEYDKSNNDTVFTCYQAIEPRFDRDPNSGHKSQKPFMSNYWIDGANSKSDQLLEESGYDHNPILATRWEPVGNDAYSPSPGSEALPDIKMLQTEQTRKGEAIDKKVRPPMKGPASMKNNPRSILPGSMTYVDDPTGQGYTAAFNVQFDIRELKEDIMEVKDSLQECFYAKLFLMLQNMDGVQPRNVLELTQRKEEQLLQLGPVLERLYRERLTPYLNFVRAVMLKARILAPPPPELQTGMGYTFTGTLAQAQKAVATGAVERLASFAGSLAAGKPEVLDKLDGDQMIDEYADMVGAPAKVVLADDKVKGIRDQRAKLQQQAMAAQQAAQLAPAAKDGAQAAAVMAGADGGGGVSAAQLLSSLGISG